MHGLRSYILFGYLHAIPSPCQLAPPFVTLPVPLFRVEFEGQWLPATGIASYACVLFFTRHFSSPTIADVSFRITPTDILPNNCTPNIPQEIPCKIPQRPAETHSPCGPTMNTTTAWGLRAPGGPRRAIRGSASRGRPRKIKK